MTLQLINEYTSHNLGDAVIYETLAQLAGPTGASTHMCIDSRRHVRGVSEWRADDATNAYVSVGGDIFNNARPLLVTRRFLHNLSALTKPPAERTFLFGQSIPHSCRGVSLRMLAHVLKRLSSVTVRDADSHARLRACGVRAELSHDVAFAYRPSAACASAGRRLFERAGIDPGRTVLMSVRGFDAMYPHDNRRFVERMADLARRLLARGHQPAVLVQAAAGGADSDRAVVQRLRELVPQLGVLDPFTIDEPHHPVDALMGALAQAHAVVAVRYHTAVLRLLAGRVPYNLHYSIKGQDLTQRLSLPGTALDDFDPEAAIAGIEASAERHHYVTPQQTHVRQSFAVALAAATGVSRRGSAPGVVPSQT